MKNKIAIVIPAKDEELVLEKTIKSLLERIPKKNIYLVNDGSTDKTGKIAEKFLYKKNILTRKGGKGKANAINSAVKSFKLPKKYEYIMPIDADTLITKNFTKEILKIFEKDKSKQIAAVSGRVVGDDNNAITSFRLWEYEVAQSIYKNAQSIVGAIVVCPGCSTVYRSKILQKNSFPEDTATEDMDLTFTIHRKGLGKIVFAPNAYVVTQDPQTVRELVKQLKRWYKGFWKCIVKHNIPWGGQILDAEVALLATEGLINSIFVLALFYLIPKSINAQNNLLVIPFVFDLLIFTLPTLIYTAVKRRKYKMPFYILHFYVLRTITSIVFLSAFFAVMVANTLGTRWQTKRYKFSQKTLWYSHSLD